MLLRKQSLMTEITIVVNFSNLSYAEVSFILPHTPPPPPLPLLLFIKRTKAKSHHLDDKIALRKPALDLIIPLMSQNHYSITVFILKSMMTFMS